MDANAEGVQEAGRKEKGPRNERCSLIDASRNVQGREEVFANVSTGADTKANTSGTGAHLSSVIFVSLRMAPSAETPSAPMPLPQRLRARGIGNGERVGVSMGVDTKVNTWGSGALQGGNLRLLEDDGER